MWVRAIGRFFFKSLPAWAIVLGLFAGWGLAQGNSSSWPTEFSDEALWKRQAYLRSVRYIINFNPTQYPPTLRKRFSATFDDVKGPLSRVAWTTATDTGWVSGGGVDPYEVHKALLQAPSRVVDGLVVRGPVTISPDMVVDLTGATPRFEAKMGNKILAFRTPENRRAYADLVEQGLLLEVQDMQCAMAPANEKRPHLAGSSLMVVNAVEYPAQKGGRGFYRVYNSSHVASTYDIAACAQASNEFFAYFNEQAHTPEGLAKLMRSQAVVADEILKAPALTTPQANKNIHCLPAFKPL